MSGFRSAHFGLKHRVIAFVSRRLFGNVVYTIRHGLAAGMRRKGGLGFLPLLKDSTPESEFLGQLELAGKTVYDIGGFEGVLTLFFASKADAVVTWEPNPRNYALCVENARLNALSNVRVLNRGLSSSAGEIELVFDPLMPGAGSGSRDVVEQISSSVAAARKIRIRVGTLDADVAEFALPAPNLIKIDIEGMELQALQGMPKTLEQHGPDLFIELHGAELPDKQRNAAAVLGFLEAARYRCWDVENRTYVTTATFGPHPPSHLFCTR